MQGKPESHHHTCRQSTDHHCPGCCSCECCGESRKYHHYRTHRAFDDVPPLRRIPPHEVVGRRQRPWGVEPMDVDVDEDLYYPPRPHVHDEEPDDEEPHGEEPFMPVAPPPLRRQ